MQRSQPKGVKSDATARAGLVFVAQRLAELTNRFSLDSHKAPTVHFSGLISEALRQVEGFGDNHFTPSASSIEPIIKELVERAKDNIILKRMMPIDRLVSLYDLYNHPEKEQRLKVLKEEISPQSYSTACMQLLIEYVHDNKKSEIDFLCRELISTLINLGMSKEHLYLSIFDFFFVQENHIADPECLRRFLLEVFPHYHDFILCFKVSDFGEALANNHFSRFSMKLADSVPNEFSSVSPDILKYSTALPSDKFLIVKNIRAFDRFSAIRKAQKSISLIQNLFRMYNHQQKLLFNDYVLVNQCCSDEIKLAPCQVGSIHAVYDDRPTKAARRLDQVLKETGFVRGEDKNKFFSIVEFHGMSLDATSSENQLLNLGNYIPS